MKARFIATLTLCLAASAGADQTHPELPDQEAVAVTLKQHPLLHAASARLAAGQAHEQRLISGSHEWTLRYSQQQRTTRATPQERFREWDSSLERPMRLPGKAKIDRELGASGIALARAVYGDTLHELSRELLKTWFEVLRSQAQQQAWQQHSQVMAQLHQAVQRRQELGDASRLESTQIGAAWTQAQAQWRLAQSKAAVAQQDLNKRFPGLALPTQLPTQPPAPFSGDGAYWLARITQHSHELLMARTASQQARLTAQRAEQDKTPDPSFGVRIASERAGEERITGLTFSIPLPGAGRQALALAQWHEAEAASAQEAATLRKITSEAANLIQETSSAYQVWQEQQQAAQGLSQAAHMTERAYHLGEGSLSDMLLARRLAFDAQLAAQLAQLDALEKQDRLLLDAHQLWPLHSDDGDEAHDADDD